MRRKSEICCRSLEIELKKSIRKAIVRPMIDDGPIENASTLASFAISIVEVGIDLSARRRRRGRSCFRYPLCFQVSQIKIFRPWIEELLTIPKRGSARKGERIRIQRNRESAEGNGTKAARRGETGVLALRLAYNSRRRGRPTKFRKGRS